MDLEKKLLGALCCVLLSGCVSFKEKQRAAESEIYVTALERAVANETVTNTIPVPPGIAPQKIVTKRASLRAFSVPVPERYVVVRWDPSADATITWRVTWTGFESSAQDWQNVTQNKLDLVSLFKARQVPPGWYRIDVCAVNVNDVESDPVSVAFFWHPLQ